METGEIVGDSEKKIAKEWFEELRDMIHNNRITESTSPYIW